MIIQRANMQGFSLIELLIALALGSAVIGSLSGLFVQLERSAQRQQHEQHLAQQLASVLEALAQELRRAGYHRGEGQSATFAGANLSVVTSSQGKALGMIYQLPVTQSRGEYLHVVYRYEADEQQLLLCESTSAVRQSMAQVMRSTRAEPCYKVVDPNQYQVTAWFCQVHVRTSSSGEAVQTVMISLTLQANVGEIAAQTQQITGVVVNGGKQE